MGVQYITEQGYVEATKRLGGSHWNNANARWVYHDAAQSFVRQVNPTAPSDVLEIGTMGVSVVNGSDTLDYAEKWSHKGFNPTYLHDARKFPWPIRDGRYDVVVALRVFHHLTPHQKACFDEARRIARNIIIVAPEEYKVAALQETSRGITEEDVLSWNGGVPPTAKVAFKKWIGNLYFWDEETLKKGSA